MQMRIRRFAGAGDVVDVGVTDVRQTLPGAMCIAMRMYVECVLSHTICECAFECVHVSSRKPVEECLYNTRCDCGCLSNLIPPKITSIVVGPARSPFTCYMQCMCCCLLRPLDRRHM
jgi:hypothetical protein